MIKGINKYAFVLILTSLILLSSCDSNVLYTDAQVMAEENWELLNTPVFNIPVNDTVNSFRVFFTIRTGSAYPFRNIFLFVSTTAPDGNTLTDTLQYYLADEKGQWYGKGVGDVHELDLPFKSNVYFPVKGTYRFKVQHGMRVEDLKGVYDFGLRIEEMRK